MLVSYSWLKEIVSFDLSPRELADRLTYTGVEVVEIHEIGGRVEKCVLGKVLEIKKHPQADSLNLVTVKLESETREIVCGADNLIVDRFVPVALEGCTLPNGVKIKKSTIRGIVSNGMICSLAELGLPHDPEDDGIYNLPKEVTFSSDIQDYLEDVEYILETEPTTNRGDCLSIMGVAREVSVIVGNVLKQKENFQFIEKEAGIQIKVDNIEFCPRYMGRVLKNIQVKPSPDWLKKRLELHGIKSINNIVDVTNYIMLFLGQPLHAFDYNCIEKKEIHVRGANKGEKIVVIGGREVELHKGDQVISDNSKALAIAGVIGGEYSSVTSQTKDIFLECAYFDPRSIRKTSKNHKLFTDSAQRYIRSIDISAMKIAIDMATKLLIDSTGCKKSGFLKEVYFEKQKPTEIIFDYSFVKRMLNEKIEDTQITKILQLLGFNLKQIKQGNVLVSVPMWRKNDVRFDVDLVEEITRFYGYDQIGETKIQAIGKQKIPHRSEEKYIQSLISLGYNQALNNSFVENKFYDMLKAENILSISNPINEEYSSLRLDLLYGLMSNIQNNENKKIKGVNRFFELGNTFRKTAKGEVEEERKLAMICYGQEEKSWYSKERELDFYDIKGDLEQLFEQIGFNFYEIKHDQRPYYMDNCSASILSNGKELGCVGQVSPYLLKYFGMSTRFNVFYVEMRVKELELLLQSKKKIKKVSPYPSVYRDMALIMKKDFEVNSMLRHIKKFSNLIKEVHLRDIYEGKEIEEGMYCSVFSLEYNSLDRTLDHEEVDQIEKELAKVLIDKFKVGMR